MGVPLRVELQFATRRPWVPGPVLLRRWARAAHLAGLAALPARRRQAFTTAGRSASLCVRVVGATEGRRLNAAYRGKEQPTNVLSFPASAAERAYAGTLGDLVVCAAVVAREAVVQSKPPAAHWAHMIVHGTLHLLGYDHQASRAARRMEALEVEILRGFGYQNPYRRVTVGLA